MELFDTHCHFESSDADETAAILRRAMDAGVTHVMAVGGSAELNAGVAAAVGAATGDAALPEVAAAIGLDRDQAGKEESLDSMDWSRAAAVGEIGLDYHYPGATRGEQMALFARQLEIARSIGLPVVVHTREADDDTLGLLREIPSRGIIHCFTGSPRFCRALLDLGFMISISGIVTFRAADNVREAALLVPDDRILVETDSPFLAPVPMRGKANEPAFIVYTARFLATLRSTPPDEFAALTTRNAIATLGAVHAA